MTTKSLPDELTSLIHHIELNRSGWREKALEHIVLAVFLLEGSPATLPQVRQTIQSRFGIPIETGSLQERLNNLCKEGSLVVVDTQRFKISEETKIHTDKEMVEGKRLGIRVKEKFTKVAKDKKIPIEPDELWAKFNEEFLFPLVWEFGARTYELFSGERLDLSGVSSYRDFVSNYPPEFQPSIIQLISSFLIGSDDDIRAYVLRYLNAYFLLQAVNMEDTSLAAITSKIKGITNFTIFLDTNFLFSILDLHDNPSNEAAKSLQFLVEELSSHVNIKFYVLPNTIEEARRTLTQYELNLSEIRTIPNLTKAAEFATGHQLSGITKRFFQVAKTSKHPITAKEYFAPFINNLVTVVRSHNVELYNTKMDHWSTAQPVIDDIVEQQEFEGQRNKDRTKSYETIEHAVVLWHFVKSLRPASIESPLDVGYWIATIDFRFLGFDSYKRREETDVVPICAHPSALAHMLQFWVPRTSRTEMALLSSLGPMLPNQFDVEAERITIKILRVLSRFEDIDNLREDTIASILMNDALRQRLSSERNIEQQIEIVRESLIADLETISSELSEKQTENLILEEQVESLSQQRNEDKKIYAEQLDRVASQRAVLDKRVNQLERDLEDRNQKDSERERQEMVSHRRRRFAIIHISILLLAVVFAYFVSSYVAGFLACSVPYTTVGLVLAALLAWLILIDYQGLKDQAVNTWTPFKILHLSRKKVFMIIGTLILAITANYLFQFVVLPFLNRQSPSP